MRGGMGRVRGYSGQWCLVVTVVRCEKPGVNLDYASEPSDLPTVMLVELLNKCLPRKNAK